VTVVRVVVVDSVVGGGGNEFVCGVSQCSISIRQRQRSRIPEWR